MEKEKKCVVVMGRRDLLCCDGDGRGVNYIQNHMRDRLLPQAALMLGDKFPGIYAF